MTDTTQDPEIAAMAALASALHGLDAEAQGRVMKWAASRYGIADLKIPEKGRHEESEDQSLKRGGDGSADQASTIHDLFERAKPKTQMDRALVAAYWFQVVQGATGFGSFVLNKELKNMGIGIGNITDALSSAEAAKPALVMQTAKSGKSRQARKTYKLTTAGIKYVDTMVVNVDD